MIFRDHASKTAMTKAGPVNGEGLNQTTCVCQRGPALHSYEILFEGVLETVSCRKTAPECKEYRQ